MRLERLDLPNAATGLPIKVAAAKPCRTIRREIIGAISNYFGGGPPSCASSSGLGASLQPTSTSVERRKLSRHAYLRAAQAYMLISMPTGTSMIFGVFQAISTLLLRGT